MIAVAWATLGVLAAAVFGMFAALMNVSSSLNHRIDALGTTLTARIDALETNLNARIDALDSRVSARIDAQTARIDVLSAALDAHLRPSAG